MQRPLDPHSFRKNVYERPTQDWICGHSAEGHACPLGPDARGNCRHTGECIPAKKGERWLCTRTEACGGKCTEGPLPNGACAHPIPPCQPVPSLRKSRGMVVWMAIGLTAGALLLFLGSSLRSAWINPGALTNAHAPSTENCSDCHLADSIAGAHLLTNSSPAHAKGESALCLKCHALGDNALHAHSVAPAVLAEKQRQTPEQSKPGPFFLRVSRAVAAPAAHGGEIACATCHQEHHGRQFDLTRLSNAQCQSCHSAQFASFGKGHPEFAAYPYQRRTRIFFDHAKHLQQHFAEKKDVAPANCQSCHEPGPAGRFMQVKDFNVSCAACHSPQIKGEGMTVKGVAFFTVPGLDIETLAAHGTSVGEWPKFADGKLTPFMELLLRDDPAASTALEKLRGVDLLDLSKATPEQLAAAENLAWATKSLLFHFVTEGQPFLIKRMNDEIAPAGLEVPRAAFIAAQTEWMPHLLSEVASYEKGIKPPLPEKTKPTSSAPSPAPSDKAPAPGDESLVGDEDLTAASTPTPTPTPTSGGDEDLTGGDLLEAQPSATPAPAAAAEAAPVALPAEEWVAAGGWYRPQDSFTLFYRPVGHADPFLVAWLDAAARRRPPPAASQTHDPFQALSDPQNPGLCLKCHTIEQTGGAVAINWQPAHPDAKSRPFTTFSHSTHMSQVGDTGCQKCHALDPQSNYAAAFAREPASADQLRPVKFQSNFAPISKMLCAECHQPRIAGDACIVCHRYHAAPVPGKLTDIGRFRVSAEKTSRLKTERDSR